MRKKYDIVATVGKYTDRQTGEEKKRYQNCGALFEDDEGRMSIKLDTVPCTPEWSGWFSLFEPRERDGAAPQPARQRQAPAPRDNSATEGPDDADEIPFAPIHPFAP